MFLLLFQLSCVLCVLDESESILNRLRELNKLDEVMKKTNDRLLSDNENNKIKDEIKEKGFEYNKY